MVWEFGKFGLIFDYDLIELWDLRWGDEYDDFLRVGLIEFGVFRIMKYYK